jgi:hypothetical protein
VEECKEEECKEEECKEERKVYRALENGAQVFLRNTLN